MVKRKSWGDTSFGVIYFMRARTEERHLSIYPEYVAYAEEEMNSRSMFRHLTKFMPFLAYRRPRC